MNDIYSIISGLCQSGLNVAFCDESETSGSPRVGLAPNLRILCALVMSSDAYAESKRRLDSRLSSLGSDVTEFHSTEIVNPGKTSPWFNISPDERVGVFEFLAQLVVKFTEKVFYCFISRDQYSVIRKKAPTRINMNYGPALRRVFLKALITQMAKGDKTPAIIMHQDRPVEGLSWCIMIAGVLSPAIIMHQDRPVEGLRIEPWSGTESFYERGAISAPAHLIPGLQLADHAAYTIIRYRLKKDKLIAGKGNPFDEQVAYSLAELSGRVAYLM